ncbi:CAMK family protein kinase [Tritrichomonas foetus]|uniref:CAMK family protein kinase n=1 Tax=Tritrichomonas foetus TaxID=1144522 RepID=A0A1J4KWL9_9EUKA|nr:CAMK family protein kinase [Tritrichomonas foetus]|eukprot:OHT13933.1 CAMK family protein kinase [Tritrichomonas foetus]
MTREYLGNIIDGFEFLEKIGHGSYSDVFLVQHTKTKLYCAAKVMCLTGMEQYELQGIYREFMIYASVDHLYISSLYHYSYDAESNVLILYLQCAPKGTLLSYVNKYGGLPESEARRLFFQIFSAIRHLHNFVYAAHRDLKLENILLDNNNNAKVTDFGLAGNNYNYKMKTFVGTPGYQAPEVVATGEYTEKCDVWSLGVCLYSMITGRLPFSIQNSNYVKLVQEASYITFPPNFSQPLRDLLTAMWAINPNDRPTLKNLQSMQWMRGILPLPTNIAPCPLKFPSDVKPGNFADLKRKKTKADSTILNKCLEYGINKEKLEDDLMNGEFNEDTTIYFLIKTPLIKRPSFPKKLNSYKSLLDQNEQVNNKEQVKSKEHQQSDTSSQSPSLPPCPPQKVSQQSTPKLPCLVEMNELPVNQHTRRKKVLNDSPSMPTMYTLKGSFQLSRICGPAPVVKPTRKSDGFGSSLTPQSRKIGESFGTLGPKPTRRKSKVCTNIVRKSNPVF